MSGADVGSPVIYEGADAAAPAALKTEPHKASVILADDCAERVLFVQDEKLVVLSREKPTVIIGSRNAMTELLLKISDALVTQ